MSSPDQNAIVHALARAKVIAEKVGLSEFAASFDTFHKRFQGEKPTLKALRTDVERVRNDFASTIRHKIFDLRREPLPGMEAIVKDYERLAGDFLNIIYPPEPPTPEMDIRKFRGAEKVEEKTAKYEGDAAGVRPIVERTIDIVARYAAAIGSGNFEAAYQMTAAGLRAWMSYKRFVGDHERAAKEYQGPALEFHIQRITFIYADEKARKKSNTSVEGWPKMTPKENRRASVNGFWIRDRAENTGCGGSLWIAEENGEYKIAKFDFWVP